MMPENCLSNQVAPCLVKLKRNENLDYKNYNFVAVQESILKITDFKTTKLVMSYGRLIINFKKQTSLQIYENVFNKGPIHLERHENKTTVISGDDFKRIDFLESQQDLVSVKSSVMDKKAFVEHLSKYYSNKNHFKSVLSQVFPIYLTTYKKDVDDQKKQLQRSIASVEFREEQERLNQAEIKAQQQNNRETFFQRTFKQ